MLTCRRISSPPSCHQPRILQNMVWPGTAAALESLARLNIAASQGGSI